MFEGAFAGALTLLGLIIVLFIELYPKVTDFVDDEESKYREEYVKSFASRMYDLSKPAQAVWEDNRKQWISSIPSVQDFEEWTKDSMKMAEKLWANVRKARSLRDRLDRVIILFLVGIITFFISPLVPMEWMAILTLIIGILTTIVGVSVLFYVVTKLYQR